MEQKHYAGVYWKGRGESVEECARRAAALLGCLCQVDHVFEHWFEKARTLAEALEHRIEPTPEALLAIMRKYHWTRAGGLVFGAWSGHDSHHGAMVQLACGCPSDITGNFCLLHLPSEGAAASRVLTVPVLTDVLRCMIEALDPDWGIVTPELQAAAYPPEERDAFAGWVSFFSHQRGQLPPLPPPVHVESLGGKGALVILTTERFSTEDPGHIELSSRVNELLVEAGVVQRLRSPHRPSPGL